MMRSDHGRRSVGFTCSVFGSVMLFGACASYPQAAASSLCEIVKEFEKYQSQLVVLHASVRSDAHHQATLQDQSCPRYGAQLSYSDLGIRNGSARRLREAIFADPPGTLKKSIDVTVTGRLTREPADAGGLLMFVADSIAEVKVTAKAKGE